MLLRTFAPLSLLLPVMAACSSTPGESSATSQSEYGSAIFVGPCGLVPVYAPPPFAFSKYPVAVFWPNPSEGIIVSISGVDPSVDEMEYAFVQVDTQSVIALVNVLPGDDALFWSLNHSSSCDGGGTGQAPAKPPPPPPFAPYPQGCVSQAVLDYATLAFCPPDTGPPRYPGKVPMTGGGDTRM